MRTGFEGLGTESYRPALVKFVADGRELRESFLEGFADRREILDWAQQLTVRTMGMIPEAIFEALADALRPKTEEGRRSNRLGLDLLLTEEQRQRPLDVSGVREWREQFAANVLADRLHAAFRTLRRDATEYTDPSDDAGTNVDLESEQNPAMRPILSELDDRQAAALDGLLSGMDSPAEILEWGEAAELATFGELEASFVRRALRERTTKRALTGGERYSLTRELLAATFLIPAFNRAASQLTARAGEVPSPERTKSEPNPM